MFFLQREVNSQLVLGDFWWYETSGEIPTELQDRCAAIKKPLLFWAWACKG